MLKRKKLMAAAIIVLMYVGTWIGGSISLNQNLSHKAELAYRRAQQSNKEEIAQAQRLGIAPPFLMPLHEGGPITSEWCVPLLPGLLVRHWDSSIGPLGGGGGNTLVFYYGFGSIELSSFGGWRN